MPSGVHWTTLAPNSAVDIRNGDLEVSDNQFQNLRGIRWTCFSGHRYTIAKICGKETGSHNGSLIFYTQSGANNLRQLEPQQRMVINQYGRVGINTTNPGNFQLQVNGSFAATSKSFLIDHPSPNKRGGSLKITNTNIKLSCY